MITCILIFLLHIDLASSVQKERECERVGVLYEHHTQLHTHAYIHTHTHAYIHKYTHTHTHTHMHIHTYAYTHAYIHTHMHTYTHRWRAPCHLSLGLDHSGGHCPANQSHQILKPLTCQIKSHALRGCRWEANVVPVLILYPACQSCHLFCTCQSCHLFCTQTVKTYFVPVKAVTYFVPRLSKLILYLSKLSLILYPACQNLFCTCQSCHLFCTQPVKAVIVSCLEEALGCFNCLQAYTHM